MKTPRLLQHWGVSHSFGARERETQARYARIPLASACPGTWMCPAAAGGGASGKNHAFCPKHAGPGMDARIQRFNLGVVYDVLELDGVGGAQDEGIRNAVECFEDQHRADALIRQLHTFRK